MRRFLPSYIADYALFPCRRAPRARTRGNRTTSFVVHISAVLGPIRVIGNDLQLGETAVLSVLMFYPLLFFSPLSFSLFLSGSSHPSVELGSRERPSRIHGRAACLRQSFPKSLYDGRRRDAAPKSVCAAEPSWKTLECSAGSNYECIALSAAANGASAHARACVTRRRWGERGEREGISRFGSSPCAKALTMKTSLSVTYSLLYVCRHCRQLACDSRLRAHCVDDAHRVHSLPVREGSKDW